MYSIAPTADPHALQVTVDRTLSDRGTQTFGSASSAVFSPLASELFGVAGIAGVELARNSIKLTKSASMEWPAIMPELEKTLGAYFG